MKRFSCTVGLALLGLACASAEPPKVEPVTTPPRLEVSLPAGVAVTIDGVERGVTPLGLEVEPGTHVIGLATACAKAEIERTLAVGDAVTIGRGDVQELGFGTLRVKARSLEGKPVVHALSVDEEVVARGERSEVVVSACAHRVQVASEGLGGWSEQIELGADEVVTRDVTLSLGPDMVRIPGGHFRMGPPDPSRYIPGLEETESLEPHEQQGWPWVHPLEVDIATFDIDRTEVTAAQFHACRSGKCPWQPMRLSYTDYPSQESIDRCTTDGRRFRTPLPGKENHPINCIARWEAEIYCASVGKRLPTDAEWEYAGRGGRQDYYCPWGPLTRMEEQGRGNCSKGRSYETEPVCSHPEENTIHGLCDILFNVNEYVTWTEGRETWPYPVEVSYNGESPPWILTRGSTGPLFEDDLFRIDSESSEVGFRCVRDLAVQEVRNGN